MIINFLLKNLFKKKNETKFLIELLLLKDNKTKI